MATTLSDAGQATVLLGLEAAMHPAFSTLRALAVLVAELSDAKVGFLSDGANSAGACLAGVLPHRGVAGKAREAAGLTAAQMIDQPLKNYFLLGIEPEFDCANAAQALSAMQQAEFVVAMTPYVTDRMRDYADVLLPMNCFSETPGTFVNCEGRWQSFAAASRAPAGSRPGWKVLRVLGNLLELEGFEQTSSEQVRDALSQLIGAVSVDNTQAMYAVDSLVRRAVALQHTPDADVSALCLHSADASRLGLADGDRASVRQDGQAVELDVIVNDRIAEGAALVSMATEVTLELGAPFGTLKIKHSRQDPDHHPAADALRRLRDLCRAQGHWLYAVAYRSQPGRAAWLVAADRRCAQADFQGNHCSYESQPLSVRACTDPGDRACTGGLGRGAVLGRSGTGGCGCQPVVYPGAVLDWRVWRHHCRLGFQLQVRIYEYHACCGADGVL
jgi:sulfur relay (sulfurtransferase) DsrF/TusC family protein